VVRRDCQDVRMANQDGRLIDSVQEVFGAFAEPQRTALTRTWVSALDQLPGAEQCIAWGMPSLRVDGDLVLSLQGFAQHNSVFPGPGVIERLTKELAGSTITKGTIHFDRDKPMKPSLVKAIARARIDEINESYPKSSGVFKEFYGNGVLKSRGRMKAGELHGSWEWFRRDGTIKRSGSFTSGRQVGTWITYDDSGQPYKETTFG
jgi:uncharacterized protein YdhG (YjbR/CyaY superfamily)